MADSITVRIDGLDGILRRLNSLKMDAPKTLRMAINDTASHARTVAVKGITAEWNIKAQDVRKTFSIRQATTNNLSAELASKGRPIPLLYFGAKQVGKAFFTKTGKRRTAREVGVRYKVKKQGGRELLQRGWINTLKRGIAVGIRRASSRLPITAPAVPGVYHAWGQQLPEQAPKLNAFLMRRVEQLIKREMEKRG